MEEVVVTFEKRESILRGGWDDRDVMIQSLKYKGFEMDEGFLAIGDFGGGSDNEGPYVFIHGEKHDEMLTWLNERFKGKGIKVVTTTKTTTTTNSEI